jgi:NAD(P)-dependent dehydrogenase (short-subunit alcohol dehydrogenase family)
VAVVTGGASGIGRSLVKELLAAGAKVFIGDVEQSALDRVLAEFEGLGDLRGQVTDVSTRPLPMFGRPPPMTGSGCTGSTSSEW